MFLTDKDIKSAIDLGDITISDFDESRLQPASYDVLLGNKFIVTDSFETPFVDPHRKVMPKTHEIDIEDDGEFILHPGVTVLGTLKDYAGSRKYLVQISGKSSLARVGLMIHNTAGIINPGHFLHVTLELTNLNAVPIILRPGMEIAQLLFSILSSETEQDYAEVGRFHGDNWANNFAEKKETKK